jgi:signal transduction histidine kinase/CheY-like chemotaxis protein/ligand-binding sensor domain-containing protein
MMRAIAILCLLYASLLPAQSPILETISIEQGLSQGFVPSICQDDDGFLWFATKNGLNRYDGYQFQAFKNDPFDSLSMDDNDLNHVEASGDFLIMATSALRIQLFHRKTQRFYTIQPFAGIYHLYEIFSIGEHSMGAIVRVGEERVLFLVQWPPDLAEGIEHGEVLEDLLQIDIPIRLPGVFEASVSGDQKKIRLLTQNSILEYDMQSGSISETALPFLVTKLQEVHGQRIVSDFWGANWVFQDEQLYRYKDQNWEAFPLPFSNGQLICTDEKSGFFWFATGSTLYGLNVKEIDSNPEPSWQIDVGHLITSCFSDQFGNIWIGTDAHGVRKFSPRSGAFKNYLDGFSIYCQPVFNERNHVFMGDVRLKTQFFKLLDLRTGQATDIERMGRPYQEPSRGIISENGRFWFIEHMEPAQLTCFDPETGTKETFPIPEECNLVFPFPLFRSSSAGEIWLVSHRQITRFDIGSRKFSIFNNPQAPLSNLVAAEHDQEAADQSILSRRSTNFEALAAERSPDGTWWIGTTNGLYKAEPDGEGQFRFSVMKAEKGNRNSLSSNSIKSLLIDPADPNLLWIGTNGNGMSRFDISKSQFTHYTTKNGLPDGVVYGILADDETPHNLWISTNRGLARFSPATGSFQYYFKSDGLQGNEFNTFASYKSASGQLFFGGVNGLTVFDPKDLTVNTQPPRVHLTEIKINGVNIGPRDSAALIQTDVAFLERLELSYSQNSIVLQFAATDYTAPQRNQFAYYLEGAEPEWVHRGFEHTAQYLNLAPGIYTFWVKAANSNGVWNEEPISLIIVIHAPWYRSWWAYLAYAVLLAWSVILFYKGQLRRKLEQGEAERLKRLDDFKSRFFTNITHEFRTPLTVILGTSEQVETKVGDEFKGKMQLIRRNGENLLRLINQILDLSKIEANALKINYVQGDLLAYLRYIAESLHSLANVQNVLLRVESDQAKIVMDYDPERMLQIVHNLLSNAIKFTPSGGRVRVQTGLTSLEGKTYLELQVSDTGVGIPQADLPHIFDRFYQADNLEKAKAGGTGIGLALTRELVQSMGGEISVESTPGQGATFTVKLPKTNKAPFLEQQAHPEEITSNHIPLTAPRVSHPSGEGPSILLIEDNPDVVEYLTSCLQGVAGPEGRPWQLDFAYNGSAGIEKALETVPDIIVSDVMMPEKDGFEVCQTLKNDERTSHIPIVLLTAKADVQSRLAGLSRGADAYLSKPFHEEELRITLFNLLEQRRKWQERLGGILQSPSPHTTADLPPKALELDEALEYAFLEKVRAQIEQRLDDSEFDGPGLAQAMLLSEAQLYRKIKALTGKSTAIHIRSIRLQKGLELLRSTALSVSEIAYQVGFKDPLYFTRTFTKEFGAAPSEMRK